MKSRKHGNGLSHRQVVAFSNRLAAQARPDDNVSYANEGMEQYLKGWADACKYFSHELRLQLREVESFIDDIEDLSL